jgi:hypothetical protein
MGALGQLAQASSNSDKASGRKSPKEHQANVKQAVRESIHECLQRRKNMGRE